MRIRTRDPFLTADLLRNDVVRSAHCDRGNGTHSVVRIDSTSFHHAPYLLDQVCQWWGQVLEKRPLHTILALRPEDEALAMGLSAAIEKNRHQLGGGRRPRVCPLTEGDLGDSMPTIPEHFQSSWGEGSPVMLVTFELDYLVPVEAIADQVERYAGNLVAVGGVVSWAPDDHWTGRDWSVPDYSLCGLADLVYNQPDCPMCRDLRQHPLNQPTRALAAAA